MLGPLGIPEPSPAAAEVHPDVMLVPLARSTGSVTASAMVPAITTILRASAQGQACDRGRDCFAAQETKAIPALSHDVPLDYVLTERKTFDSGALNCVFFSW